LDKKTAPWATTRTTGNSRDIDARERRRFSQPLLLSRKHSRKATKQTLGDKCGRGDPGYTFLPLQLKTKIFFARRALLAAADVY
jgi:hypothetical protein